MCVWMVSSYTQSTKMLGTWKENALSEGTVRNPGLAQQGWLVTHSRSTDGS